ncbi:MAG TPA: DUF3147 family protein [Ramlibacter sp.]|jgi:hypothetical protein|nr:DUF3147 family protein [Ramlibacter sp.]
MLWLAFKYLVTAAVVVAVSELARRSGRAGALLAALPIVTTLTLIWLHVEDQPSATIADHARYTFWYVLPTLPMFLAFPAMLGRWGFWPALAGSAALTLLCFVSTALVLRRFGVDLLP